MKKKLMILILVIGLLIILPGIGCSSGPKKDAGDQIIDDLISVSQKTSTAQAKASETEPTPIPTPRYDPFQVILDYGGFNDELKEYILDLAYMDPHADWIYSMAGMIVSEEMAETDILFHTQLFLILAGSQIEAFFGNTLFPCGEDIEGGFVVCSYDPLPMEPGGIYLVLMKLAEPVPTSSSERFYTYSVVFDADGDESNNFQFNPPYDWDFFQNTDRWYMLDYAPTTGWMLNVNDIVSGEFGAPSATRAVVMGDIVAFFIPASEFSVDSPGYRVTAFGHDGTYAPETSCGDVSGSDPTEPLLHFEGDLITLE